MSRPLALVFDFGNVLAFFDYGIAAERFGRPLGLSGEEFLRRARAAGFHDLHMEYEAGKIDTAEFHRRLVALAGAPADFDEFAAGWCSIFRANESTHRLVAALETTGATLVLGSNTNVLQADHFRVQFAEALSHFDRLVLSYEVGQVKPAAAFYLACAEAAGRPPGECIFIDDMPENVEGARRAGLIGLHYTETARLVSDLRDLGVAIRADFRP